MNNNILSQKLQATRTQMDQIVGELHEMTIDIGHKEMTQTVSDLRNRINEPFMFVIVGEVKAGKSSFINALLDTDREICKVAASPMTDTIQQITYGKTEQIIDVNPYLKKILQPVEILREIAIVDTPGTNTIVDHHQEITERFIPASDLIVFVFESKNPYRQSAWEFFDYIHKDWQKKIVFILQQKDLMVPADLVTNLNGVKEYAEKKGIMNPNVFAVSAKMEIAGEKAESGFLPVREYIQQHITGGKAPILKLQNNVQTSQNINQRIESGLDLRQKQYAADIEFRNDIRFTLDEQESKSRAQVDILVENLVATYDRITGRYEKELEDGLGFFSLIKRSVTSMFSKKESAKDWLDGLAGNLEKELNIELRDKLNEGVMDIADSIQQMAKIIDLKIKSSSTILKNDHELFSDIAEKRSNILKELQETFARFMSRSENFADETMLSEHTDISPNLAKGSGVAVIGVILTAMTTAPLLDITGGILTTIGLLFAGVSVGMKRGKILRGFQGEISKGRVQLEEEVDKKLKDYIANIKEKIDTNFNRFDGLLKEEKVELTRMVEKHTSISERLGKMEAELKMELG